MGEMKNPANTANVLDVTFIVPIYNGRAYIKTLTKTIAHFNDNAPISYEILFVDDGSTDDSWKIIHSLAQKNPIIRGIKKENGGIASARNIGLQNAKGTFIVFCDQDDGYCDGIAKYISILRNTQSDVIICNKYEENNGVRHKLSNIKTNRVLTDTEANDVARKLLSGGVLPLIDKSCMEIYATVYNCVFRKDFLWEHKISVCKYVDYEDDWLFVLNVLRKNPKVFLCEEAFYIWKINLQSESHTFKYIENFAQKRLALLGWMDETLDELNVEKEKRQCFYELLYRRTILWGFYNACWKSPFSIRDFKAEISCICKLATHWKDQHQLVESSIKLHGADFLFWKLLGSPIRMYFISLILNKLLVKRHYH